MLTKVTIRWRQICGVVACAAALVVLATVAWSLAVANDRVAFVANMGDDTISALDINRGMVIRTLPAGDEPDGIVFLPR
jgi:YVTN family beta-propeller protein